MHAPTRSPYGQVEEIANELDELKRNIESTEAVVNIELSHTRNRIMRLELLMTTGTLAVACGSMGAGLFGMNLASHLESNPLAFWAITGVLVSGSATSFAVLYAHCRRQGLV